VLHVHCLFDILLIFEQKARTQAQIDKLGPDGLKELEHRLEQAKKDNDPDIPRDVLKSIKTPPVESIKFIKTIVSFRYSLPCFVLSNSNNHYRQLVVVQRSRKEKSAFYLLST